MRIRFARFPLAVLGLALALTAGAQDTAPTTQPAAEKAETKEAQAEKEKSESMPENQKTYAVFVTNHGNIVAELATEKAPNTAANFIGLADGTKEYTDPKTREKKTGHYYDGVIFHRIVPGFVIQGGDPTGTGSGGPGYTIDLEIHPELRHERGALSMARSAHPNSAGSQFFIMLADNSYLDDKYAVFGHVVEGMDTVDKIAKVKLRPGTERPVEDAVMKKVRIVRGSLEDAKKKVEELQSQ